MSAPARQLFCDLLDASVDERERLLAQRQISPQIREEVESLLRYDAASGASITRLVSEAMEETLRGGLAGSYCGAYRLVELLGSGGMGAVYLAERADGEIEQKVAIKLLRAESDRPVFRERFLRERQLLACLSHPAIARLLDVGRTEDGRPYLVMEHVPGVAIDEYAGALDLPGRLKLFLMVCDGVSHAHRHQIIHRDLKPSNILVDQSGQPKLLDFGIAKILDRSVDETRTVERMLTPDYASPEQRRGGPQTTATDVFSLGAVLYKLLTGQSPRSFLAGASSAGQANVELPEDIESILRKATQKEPSDRYPTVDAFAGDVRAFLESRPVLARSGAAWYRARKFVSRHRLVTAAATVAFVSLTATLQIAHHQRIIAQQRFLQVRQLANNVLALDQAVGGLDNSTKAKQQIAAMSTVYLEALGAQAQKDRNLAIEVGEAYSLLARVQGISFSASPGQQAEAERSLGQADRFVTPSLQADANNRKALLAAARISHHRMTIAQANSRNSETAEYARKSANYLGRLLEYGDLSDAENETISQLFNDIALAYKNLYLYPEAVRHARRSVDVARSLQNPHLRLSHGLSMLANLLRLSADLEGALQAIQEARANLALARFPTDRVRRSSWALVLSREAKILGAASGIGLNRPDEAIPLFQQAFDLVEEWTQADPEDSWSRMLFATLGRDFGDIVRQREPERALEIYDHALVRLREVHDNPEARRGEAEVLSGSSYALRQVNRVKESRERVDGALRLLTETKDYPTDRIHPHDAVYEAVRALADHLAETGQILKATETYESLLASILRSEPDPQDNMAHAVAFSQIYGSLAALYRRGAQHDRAEVFAAHRRRLWDDWNRRHPDNSLLRRQLASARIP